MSTNMQKMKRRWILGAALGLGLGASAAGQAEENLFACKSYGYILGKCQIGSRQLSEAPAYREIPFEADFRVLYTFACKGNTPNVGARSGNSSRPFVMGLTRAWLDGITGSEPLVTYDPDPVTTERLSFRPGCTLQVHQTLLSPSRAAITQWNQEAVTQAKLVRSKHETYLLLKDYDSLETWDRSKLTLLRDKLAQLTQISPSNVQYALLRRTVQAALDNRPSGIETDVAEDARAKAMADVRAALEAEVNAANLIQERFAHFEQALNEELKSVLQSISLD